MGIVEQSPLLEEFLDAKAKGMKYAGPPAAPRTIDTYRQQLKRLESYAGKPLHEIDMDDVERAMDIADEKKLSPSYRNLMLSAGRGFFDWAVRNKKEIAAEGMNPFAGIRMSKRVRETAPKYITDLQFKAILRAMEQIDADNVANAIAAGPRTANLPWVSEEGRLEKKTLPVKLMYYGGLRITEAASLRIDDVMDDGVYVEGKGAKRRFVPLPKWLIKEIIDYIDRYSTDETFVFTSMPTKRQRTGHLHPSRVHEYFHEAVRSLDMPEWVTPHVLRHSFAKRALDRTGRIDVVQDLLGHDSIETTKIYANNNTDDIKRVAAGIWE